MAQYTTHDSIIDDFIKHELSDIRHYRDHCVVVLKNYNEEFVVDTFSYNTREIIWQLYLHPLTEHLFADYISAEKNAKLTEN